MAQEDKQSECNNVKIYNVDDALERYKRYVVLTHYEVRACLMKHESDHSEKSLKCNVCKKQTAVQMIQ